MEVKNKRRKGNSYRKNNNCGTDSIICDSLNLCNISLKYRETCRIDINVWGWVKEVNEKFV